MENENPYEPPIQQPTSKPTKKKWIGKTILITLCLTIILLPSTDPEAPSKIGQIILVLIIYFIATSFRRFRSR